MENKNLIKLIEAWAVERNLHTADSNRQFLKLVEEVGELSEAMQKLDTAEMEDALGDIFVVITVLGLQLGLPIERCINSAYNEIKNRTGKMVNGIYVKDE